MDRSGAVREGWRLVATTSSHADGGGLAWRHRARYGERPVGGQTIESNREPFMAPLGWGQGIIKGNNRVMGKHNCLGLLLLRVKSWVRVMQGSMKRVGERSTARQSPMATDDSRDGCHCSRYRGCNDGGSSRDHEFNTSLMEEIDAPGENSPSKRRTMMRLERELEVALRFEHRDDDDRGLRSNPIWITKILLGRLFREHQVLGKVVKPFAHF